MSRQASEPHDGRHDRQHDGQQDEPRDASAEGAAGAGEQAGSPLEAAQPAPLAAPTASRPASAEESAEEIDALRRFHLGAAPLDGDQPGDAGWLALWSWLYGAAPAGAEGSERADASEGLPHDVAAPLRALWAPLARRELEARRTFSAEARRLSRGLRALLEREPATTGEGGAERLRHELGTLGSRFVDADALSSSLGARPGRL
jgi:hypothetical protein